MKQAYLATIVLLERMHRQFLEVLKTELDQQGVRDINNVQALILYNIGKEVDLTARASCTCRASWAYFRLEQWREKAIGGIDASSSNARAIRAGGTG